VSRSLSGALGGFLAKEKVPTNVNQQVITIAKTKVGKNTKVIVGLPCSHTFSGFRARASEAVRSDLATNYLSMINVHAKTIRAFLFLVHST
jgi:hypothetical protein